MLAGLVLAAFSCAVQGAALFDTDELLEARINGPLSALFANKESTDYRGFTIAANGVEVPLKIRLRGHSRRRICEFPPLMLNFASETEPSSVFAGQDKIKLVTHCRNTDRGEHDLLEEYLAYRVLNILTGFSFRVRPMRIEYLDDADGLPGEASPRHAFLIESREEFAARTGAERAALSAFPRYAHDREHAALMYVFEYLIGNTDWQMLRAETDDSCCHNSELFSVDDELRFVPYDFDLAGLVNARYAYPDPQLRITRVRQRLYRGLCTGRPLLAAALEHVRSLEARILAAPADVPGLSPRNVRDARDYLARFFEAAQEPEALLDTFEKHCVESY